MNRFGIKAVLATAFLLVGSSALAGISGGGGDTEAIIVGDGQSTEGIDGGGGVLEALLNWLRGGTIGNK